MVCLMEEHFDGPLSPELRNRQMLEQELVKQPEGLVVGVYDDRERDNDYCHYLEVGSKLYRIRIKPGNKKFLRHFIDRGNITAGHINLMKHRGRRRFEPILI